MQRRLREQFNRFATTPNSDGRTDGEAMRASTVLAKRRMGKNHIRKACSKNELKGDSRSSELPLFDGSYITFY